MNLPLIGQLHQRACQVLEMQQRWTRLWRIRHGRQTPVASTRDPRQVRHGFVGAGWQYLGAMGGDEGNGPRK